MDFTSSYGFSIYVKYINNYKSLYYITTAGTYRVDDVRQTLTIVANSVHITSQPLVCVSVYHKYQFHVSGTGVGIVRGNHLIRSFELERKFSLLIITIIRKNNEYSSLRPHKYDANKLDYLNDPSGFVRKLGEIKS